MMGSNGSFSSCHGHQLLMKASAGWVFALQESLLPTGPGWAAAAALQSLSSGNSAFQLSLAALLCSEEGDYAFALG